MKIQTLLLSNECIFLQVRLKRIIVSVYIALVLFFILKHNIMAKLFMVEK